MDDHDVSAPFGFIHLDLHFPSTVAKKNEVERHIERQSSGDENEISSAAHQTVVGVGVSLKNRGEMIANLGALRL